MPKCRSNNALRWQVTMWSPNESVEPPHLGHTVPAWVAGTIGIPRCHRSKIAYAPVGIAVPSGMHGGADIHVPAPFCKVHTSLGTSRAEALEARDCLVSTCTRDIHQCCFHVSSGLELMEPASSHAWSCSSAGGGSLLLRTAFPCGIVRAHTGHRQPPLCLGHAL